MVTYTLTVTNNGPVEAADVVMDNTVPAELTGHLVRVHTDRAGPDLPGRHACGRGSDPPSPGRVGDRRLRHCIHRDEGDQRRQQRVLCADPHIDGTRGPVDWIGASPPTGNRGKSGAVPCRCRKWLTQK